jgi:DNA-binding PadR family transcriptional regulator
MGKKKKVYPITEEQEQVMKMFLLKIKEECDEISSMLNELNNRVMDFYNEGMPEDNSVDPEDNYNFD